ncbi:MAG: hypothetical protein HY748_09745 [Elusimicrobia bacterium]|nr:hypothetical protein [Elusimicrobiota bacterium]
MSADLESAEGLVEKVEGASLPLQARGALLSREECVILLDNMWTFARIELDVDWGNEEARRLKAAVAELRSRLEAASQALLAFLRQADEKTIEALLEEPGVGPYRFWVERLRKCAAESLPLAEERLAAILSTLRRRELD